jgi:OmpA-OmpF porin, OOP family
MTRRWLAAVLFVAVVSPRALAAPSVEGFALQTHDPTYAGDRFFVVPDASMAKTFGFAAKLTLNYGSLPLRVLDAQTHTVVPRGTLVRDQLYLHLGAAISLFSRVRIGFDLPFAAYQSGEQLDTSVPAVQSAHLGDLRLGVRVNFFGSTTDPVALGLQGDLLLPTGSRASFTSDEKVRGQIRLVASGLGGHFFAWSVALGSTLRSHQNLGLLETGSALAYSAAAALVLFDGRFQVGPEVYGSTVYVTGASPIEGLLGLRVRIGGLMLGAGVGTGLTREPGAPSLRTVINLAWEPAPEPPAPAADADGDGIPDEHDGCPKAAGPKDADPKKNGCPPPPPDTDGDGIADALDACVDVAGVASEEPSKNGCPPPPPDGDGDGVADATDACPNTAGVADADPKKNGCPPPADRDGDRVADAEDACPDTAGVADADPKKNGCAPVAELRDASIAIAQQIQFESGKAAIMPESEEVLKAVSSILAEHPEVKAVHIEGHTDNRGLPAWNQVLSRQRAEAVRDWLIKKGGIDSQRLSAAGFGMDRPLAPNLTDQGRRQNRRVEFNVSR